MLRIALVCAVVGAGWLTTGCGEKLSLPEPESQPAKLYVQYCSGQGCHGALPPQRDAWGIWQMQYDRMIALMREQGLRLPSPEEDAILRDYIQKFARRAG